ncbi:methyltransferase domain-containing protein [Roseivivax marinus]|uniref:methyltransferase domain-containing protein n=1 Tax=Roseivivax marinus TaxID=1379903 RepID=UPI001F0B290D|nr:class I SAM-dependent methyltransferase [Roseivivax marinus]
MHFAPERGLYPHLSAGGVATYDPVDFAPELFKFCNARKIDLCTDAARLPRHSYDLIIHSHIAEHIPCNITAVLFHLHRALKPGGMQLMCIPFLSGHYEEDLRALSDEEATRRFGQKDHVRKFGTADLRGTIGMIFRLPNRYSLLDWFSAETLDECNIPEAARSGFTPSTVLPVKKEDLLLADV